MLLIGGGITLAVIVIAFAISNQVDKGKSFAEIFKGKKEE